MWPNAVSSRYDLGAENLFLLDSFIDRGSRASPEAEDITIEYPSSPFTVEGHCSHARDLCPLPRKATRSHSLPDLWHLCQASRARRIATLGVLPQVTGPDFIK